MVDPLDARSVLEELVALEEIDYRIENWDTDSGRRSEVLSMMDEYRRRKPLAWAAARAFLAQPVPPLLVEGAAPAERSRSQKLRDAGFTGRPKLTGAGGLIRSEFSDAEPGPQDAPEVEVGTPEAVPVEPTEDPRRRVAQDRVDVAFRSASSASPTEGEAAREAAQAGEAQMLAFMCALHSNVPEADRPMSRSDFSDAQWARVVAAFAMLTPSPQAPDKPTPGEIESFLSGIEQGQRMVQTNRTLDWTTPVQLPDGRMAMMRHCDLRPDDLVVFMDNDPPMPSSTASQTSLPKGI